MIGMFLNFGRATPPEKEEVKAANCGEKREIDVASGSMFLKIKFTSTGIPRIT